MKNFMIMAVSLLTFAISANAQIDRDFIVNNIPDVVIDYDGTVTLTKYHEEARVWSVGAWYFDEANNLAWSSATYMGGKEAVSFMSTDYNNTHLIDEPIYGYYSGALLTAGDLEWDDVVGWYTVTTIEYLK